MTDEEDHPLKSILLRCRISTPIAENADGKTEYMAHCAVHGFIKGSESTDRAVTKAHGRKHVEEMDDPNVGPSYSEVIHETLIKMRGERSY